VDDLFRTQFRPVFGEVFDYISKASDWSRLSCEERGGRLAAGMRALDQKYRRPFRFEDGFDFARIAERLENYRA
jgi:hypothetical protein